MKHSKLTALAAVMVICAVILPIFTRVNAAVPEPESVFYVADWANCLTDELEEYIVEKNDELYAETGAQLVVVTVDFVQNGDLEQYAYNLFNEWGIGSSTENNGVLLLLSIGDDDYWCMQGTGLERTLTSGTIGNMLAEYLEPDFARQDYDSGVRKIFDALWDKLADIYDYDSEPETTYHTPSTTDRAPSSTSSSSSGIPAWLVILILFFVVKAIFSGDSSGCVGCLFGWLLGSGGGYHHHHGPPPPHGGGYHRPGGFGGSRPGGFREGGGSSHSGGSRGGGGGASRGGGAGRRR